MDYLVYVAHDAENLQFFLWLRDYTKRFDALPQSEKSRSKPWDFEDYIPDLTTSPNRTLDKSDAIIRELPAAHSLNNDKSQPPSPPLVPPKDESGFSRKVAAQPFRAEVDLITSHYLLQSSPRELNLSYKARTALLQALSETTHPSAFSQIQTLITVTLRNQSHPNFVRWTLCNGNKPRVLFLRTFAIFWLFVAVILAIVLTLSRQPRWIRIVVAPVLWFGAVNLIAASKGLCVLLHRLHTREIRPWEIIPETPGTTGSSVFLGSPSAMSSHTASVHHDVEGMENINSTSRLSPFGPANAYVHEPWLRRWQRTTFMQKMRLRKVWVREEGLRLMQNKIVIQAELWSLLITIVLVTSLVALPSGDYF